MHTIKKGITKSESFIVCKKDLAINVGSGSLEVYATPAMIAHMEGTSMRLLNDYLDSGFSSVGIAIDVKHIKASKENDKIFITAEIENIEDRKINFKILAKDINNEIVGSANHDRFIINEEKFMSKIQNS